MFDGYIQAAQRRLDNALVGLVRDNQLNIFQGELRFFHCFFGRLPQDPGGKAEYFPPVHL